MEEVVALTINLMSIIELLITAPNVEFQRFVDVSGELLVVVAGAMC